MRLQLNNNAAAPPLASLVHLDETKYAAQYECACRDYRLRLYGRQRAMTDLEKDTLFLWADRHIHLEQPPKFITETHIGEERDAF